ncbi:carbon-nitrogen hydrolase family protein [Candidatus Bipolaricaulota bacterium]|nr:carbon-nitrogen hydrolase family protein [Candidatus Bipolaricaulota bacterium]
MGFRAAVVQMNSVLCEVDANLAKVATLVRGAAAMGAKLVLVPETFTTGYDVGDRLPQVADTIPGRTTDAVGRLAREHGVYFYGSFIEKDGRRYHNTAVLVDPKGEILAAYRKVHLFAAEKRMFTPGDRPAVVDTELGTLGLTICMDLLFPEYIRGLVLAGAEYILNTTDWLRWGPIDRWGWCHAQPRALAVVRALENTVGLAMACQWGQEGEYVKFGHSCIVSPSGRILAGVEEGEGVAVHELSLDGIEEWRRIATYLADRADHLALYRKLLDL